MFKKLCIVTLMVASLNSTQAEELKPLELPKDVLALSEQSQECAQWIELWDPSLEKAHKDYVEANVNSVCLAIIEERTKLMEKYKNHPEILEYLQ